MARGSGAVQPNNSIRPLGARHFSMADAARAIGISHARSTPSTVRTLSTLNLPIRGTLRWMLPQLDSTSMARPADCAVARIARTRSTPAGTIDVREVRTRREDDEKSASLDPNASSALMTRLVRVGHWNSRALALP